MSSQLVQDLIEAGAHFGHRASRWNPKMAPFIFARQNLVHIIDIRETIRGILRAKKYLGQVAAKGGTILFVGTKKQAGPSIATEAERCGMPYVSERWLGGTLTNFRTIRGRMSRLEELERIREGEEIAKYSKKMQSALNREYRKIYRNLNGVRDLNRIPDVMFIVDPNKESNAVREARSVGVPIVALLDTDCDPDKVDLPVPGNDDGIRSVELIVRQIADGVVAGKQQSDAQKKGETPAQAVVEQTRPAPPIGE